MLRVYHLLWIFLLILVTGTQTKIIRSCEDKKCSHDCEIVGEIPVCICPPDLTLDINGRTCKESTESTAFLLAMFRGVKILNEGSDDEELVAPVKTTAIDYNFNKKELYVYTNSTIVKFPISKGKGASPITVVTETDTAVTSLAADWVHDVIYWISQRRSSIEVASLEGADHRVVLSHSEWESESVGDWDDLVVDPYVKKLFWIGKEGVYTLDLETKNFTQLIEGMQPEALTIDTSSRLLYVMGQYEGSNNKCVARIKYDGSKAGDDIVIGQLGSKVYGFGVLGETLYWESNHDGENLYKCELRHTGGKPNISLVAEINQIVYDMKIFHQNIQKPVK